jgi:hypothetical protein
VATYETYPLVDHGPDHGLILTKVAQNGIQEVVVLGPYTESKALAELAVFAQRGTLTINVTNSLVMRVSDHEVVVVHDSFLSKWTVRAVVGTYVPGAS